MMTDPVTLYTTNMGYLEKTILRITKKTVPIVINKEKGDGTFDTKILKWPASSTKNSTLMTLCRF